MSWWTADKQAYAVNYLIGNGLSPWGAAALVSRWANVESSGGPASVNRYSGAFGIAQWLGARKTPIAGNTNFDAQLAYVVAELSGPESRAAALLRGATDAYSGAVGASVYERAEGYNSSSGVDNFTSRTAAGASAVLSTVQAGVSGYAGGSQNTANDFENFFGIPVDYGGQDTNASPFYGAPSSSFGSSELILAGVAVLALFVLLDI